MAKVPWIMEIVLPFMRPSDIQFPPFSQGVSETRVTSHGEVIYLDGLCSISTELYVFSYKFLTSDTCLTCFTDVIFIRTEIVEVWLKNLSMKKIDPLKNESENDVVSVRSTRWLNKTVSHTVTHCHCLCKMT